MATRKSVNKKTATGRNDSTQNKYEVKFVDGNKEGKMLGNYFVYVANFRGEDGQMLGELCTDGDYVEAATYKTNDTAQARISFHLEYADVAKRLMLKVLRQMEEME